MITENFLYFQHRDGTHDYLVNATEYRSINRGKFWTVTIVNHNGHQSFKPESREKALDMAQGAVCPMMKALCEVYIVV